MSASYPQFSASLHEAKKAHIKQYLPEKLSKVVFIIQKMYIAIGLTNKLDVMSLSPGSAFKETVSKHAKGLAIAASVFTAPVMAESAGETAVNDIPNAPGIENKALSRAQRIEREANQVTVPILDSRDVSSKRVARTVTAASSRDGVTVAVYGKDKNLFNEAKLAVYDAYKMGLPVHGIVVGPLDEKRGIDVYADGQRWTEHEPLPGQDMRRATLVFIKHAHSGMVLVQKELAERQAELSPVAYNNE